MYAAIAYVDKQSFPFTDVLRVCFSEIANHAKINGAKDVSLIAGNIFCKAVYVCVRFYVCVCVSPLSATTNRCDKHHNNTSVTSNNSP